MARHYTGRFQRERRSDRHQRGDSAPLRSDYWVREVCGEPMQCWLAEAEAIVTAANWPEAIAKFRAGEYKPGPAAMAAERLAVTA